MPLFNVDNTFDNKTINFQYSPFIKSLTKNIIKITRLTYKKKTKQQTKCCSKISTRVNKGAMMALGCSPDAP